MTVRIVDFTMSRATKTIVPQPDARIWSTAPMRHYYPSILPMGDLEYRITIYRLPQGASVDEVPVDQLPIPRSLPFAAAPLMCQTFVSANGRRSLLDLQNMRPQMITVKALKNSLDNVKTSLVSGMNAWHFCHDIPPCIKGKRTTYLIFVRQDSRTL